MENGKDVDCEVAIDEKLLDDLRKMFTESEDELSCVSSLIESVNDLNDNSVVNESEMKKRFVLFSFPVPSKPFHLPYATQKSLIANTLLSHKWFSKGHILQTHETGVLYPITHFIELALDEEKDNVCLLDRWELGKGMLLYQSLYEELFRMDIPVIVTPNPNDKISTQAFIIVGIKTLDHTFNTMFEENWKELSGARSIYLSLSTDYGLSEIILYRRVKPQDCTSFVYVLLVKLNNVTITNHLFLLDYVHRMRLRMLGYISLYGHLVEKTVVVDFSQIS
ncbi:hypothetical protein B4U79_00809 [Dinothrombium tinctorium]|uniref:DUF7153 domain-containing protein n=1 Tax=Dinothrombium tinctorium TaxID=1965070 RepID=A0A3S3NUT9_9ACAR|nr:hypothetical protein B4U79_05380 [Dinothrombium tinctorium]RWS14157.1 hypothetical protein B4U79_12817 [Dinothrombium tinctorium]RWS14196.1 hypothetical protein B4U79_00809 [Dinothrombium tinctorium]